VGSTGPGTSSAAHCSSAAAASGTVPSAPPSSAGSATPNSPISAIADQQARAAAGSPERTESIDRARAAAARTASHRVSCSSEVAMDTD